jgi:hypothetical protein
MARRTLSSAACSRATRARAVALAGLVVGLGGLLDLDVEGVDAALDLGEGGSRLGDGAGRGDDGERGAGQRGGEAGDDEQARASAERAGAGCAGGRHGGGSPVLPSTAYRVS